MTRIPLDPFASPFDDHQDMLGWSVGSFVKKAVKAANPVNQVKQVVAAVKSPKKALALLDPTKDLRAIAPKKLTKAINAASPLTQAKKLVAAVKDPKANLRAVLDPTAQLKAAGVSEKFVNDVRSAARKVAQSPVTRVAAAGVAVAFPAVGIPAVAALETANRVMAAADSAEAKVKKVAHDLIKRTHALAKNGNADARRGLEVLAVAKRARDAKKVTTSARVASASKAKMKTVLAAPGGGQLVAALVKSKVATGGPAQEGVLVMPNGRVARGKWVAR